MQDRAKHKLCRRLGACIWGKAKCPSNRRPYPAGQHGKNSKNKLSTFGELLLHVLPRPALALGCAYSGTDRVCQVPNVHHGPVDRPVSGAGRCRAKSSPDGRWKMVRPSSPRPADRPTPRCICRRSRMNAASSSICSTSPKSSKGHRISRI